MSFSFLRSAIGIENSSHPLHQSDVKVKPIATSLRAFSSKQSSLPFNFEFSLRCWRSAVLGAERKMKVFHFSLRPQNLRSPVTQATFSYHWLLILFSLVVICCCDSFDYSFTRNVLWVTLQDIKQLGVTATTTVTLTWNLMRWNGRDGSSSYILS